MSKADGIQVGGSHYKKGGAMQHWNMLVLLGWGWEYYLGAATKYATRYQSKNGVQDVGKAIHFCDKLIELINERKVPVEFETRQGLRLNLDSGPGLYTRCVNVEQLTLEYCDANDIPRDSVAHDALYALFAAVNVQAVEHARGLLSKLSDELQGIDRTPPPPPTQAEIATSKAQQAADALGADAGPSYVNQDRPIIGDNQHDAD